MSTKGALSVHKRCTWCPQKLQKSCKMFFIIGNGAPPEMQLFWKSDRQKNHDCISRVFRQVSSNTPRPPRAVRHNITSVAPEKNAYDTRVTCPVCQKAAATSSATGPTGLPINTCCVCEWGMSAHTYAHSIACTLIQQHAVDFIPNPTQRFQRHPAETAPHHLWFLPASFFSS